MFLDSSIVLDRNSDQWHWTPPTTRYHRKDLGSLQVGLNNPWRARCKCPVPCTVHSYFTMLVTTKKLFSVQATKPPAHVLRRNPLGAMPVRPPRSRRLQANATAQSSFRRRAASEGINCRPWWLATHLGGHVCVCVSVCLSLNVWRILLSTNMQPKCAKVKVETNANLLRQPESQITL